jgi:hypothetical protein
MAEDMYGSYDAFMSKTVGPAGGDEGAPVDSQYPYREYTRGVGIVFDESFDEYGTKVIVQKLQSGESASKSRMISAGDMIVAVNGVDVSGREIRFLRSLIPGPRKISAQYALQFNAANAVFLLLQALHSFSLPLSRSTGASTLQVPPTHCPSYACHSFVTFQNTLSLTLSRSNFSELARLSAESFTLDTKPLK